MSPDLRSPLGRYRLMAWIVGVMLIAVFALIPLSGAEKVIGPVHGLLYVIYLATVVNMWVAYRLGFWYLAGMVVAGWCPFLSFVVERLISKRLAGSQSGYTLPSSTSRSEP